jgi:hypothetical protein
MSTEIRKPEFDGGQHPDEGQLLMALEHELSPEEADEIDRHIGTCWNCRARFHEIQNGILAFVEYRERVYLPELESAPGNFGGFSSSLQKAAAEDRKTSVLEPLRMGLRNLADGLSRISIQTKWVSATAAIMIAVLFWTQILNPTTLSASELLSKAVRAQNPPAKQNGVQRKIRQKVRFRTQKTDIVREFQWETGAPISAAAWEAQSDPDLWSAPLTAAGFAKWRDSLSARKDEVNKSGGRWTLETTAVGGPIKEASIVIRDSDFHPTEQHIRFSDDRRLDLEEVSFEITPETPQTISAPSPARPLNPHLTPKAPDAGAPLVVDLNEAELDLRYVIFTQHWDEGEDLQIARTADAVVVNGAASSEERFREIQEKLGNLPGVRLSISAPGSTSTGPDPAVSQSSPAPSSVPLLKDALDSAFGSPGARRNFVDENLAAADSALSHAWALRRLVDRYTEADRRALKIELQIKLDQMLGAHLQQLAAANTRLDGLLDFLPPGQPAHSDTPTEWRAGAAALFNLVRQQDSLVAALIAGTQTGQTAATASDRFRTAHEAAARLAAELRPPGNAPIGK